MTHLIERFTEHLKKGKYNLNTITAYRKAIFVFYNHFRDLPHSKFTEAFISDYLIEMTTQKSNNHDAIQSSKALKLFFEIIFHKSYKFSISEKNKEESHLIIFSREEVTNLFTTIKNLKHKLLLMLVYNSGLKINEVINLKVSDLDLNANTINIKSSNSKKNRLLRLSPNLNVYITQYLEKYHPSTYLFSGADHSSPFTARNIQLFFQKLLRDSNIGKEASINNLRHSYAVHSLESGLDIHLLQKILGHNNIQTTSIYLPYINLDISKIGSPFESLNVFPS